jgi:hypothetical protein
LQNDPTVEHFFDHGDDHDSLQKQPARMKRVFHPALLSQRRELRVVGQFQESESNGQRAYDAESQQASASVKIISAVFELGAAGWSRMGSFPEQKKFSPLNY